MKTNELDPVGGAPTAPPGSANDIGFPRILHPYSCTALCKAIESDKEPDHRIHFDVCDVLIDPRDELIDLFCNLYY